jgi:hypothetical protein
MTIRSGRLSAASLFALGYIFETTSTLGTKVQTDLWEYLNCNLMSEQCRA